MVHHTRLDCTIGAAGLMRQALAQALHHARHRSGLPAPPHRSAADAQRARRPGPRVRGGDGARCCALARAFDAAQHAPRPRRFARIATAVGKYWVCKRAPALRRRGAGMPRRQRLRRGIDRCPGSTARLRSTPSGRARATSSAWTCCAPCDASPRRWRLCVAELDLARGGDRRYDRFLDRLDGGLEPRRGA